jgi:hypothetical protein
MPHVGELREGLDQPGAQDLAARRVRLRARHREARAPAEHQPVVGGEPEVVGDVGDRRVRLRRAASSRHARSAPSGSVTTMKAAVRHDPPPQQPKLRLAAMPGAPVREQHLCAWSAVPRDVNEPVAWRCRFRSRNRPRAVWMWHRGARPPRETAREAGPCASARCACRAGRREKAARSDTSARTRPASRVLDVGVDAVADQALGTAPATRRAAPAASRA